MIASIVIIFIIVNFIKSDKHRFDSTSASIESIALIVFSILFFFDLLNRPQPFMITALPEFWVVLAIMVYMSSTLFLFIIANISEREADKYWFINTISNIVSNIIFCIAFITNRYAQPNPPVEKPSL